MLSPVVRHFKMTALLTITLTLSLATGVAVSKVSRPGTTKPVPDETGTTHTPVALTGGHGIDPRDHGRPVVLVAAGLNVPTEVFRKAFSGVTPARGRGPTGDEARRNKSALLKVLAPYGVTNDRLDEVSNRYRYRPESGELWTHTPASIIANVRGRKIVSFTVVNAGSGYSTPPEISVPGFPDAKFKINLIFTSDLEKNGSVADVDVIR